MSKLETHTMGTRKSDDPTDPMIYPSESYDESLCMHGLPGNDACAMCDAEKAEAKRKREIEAIKD